MFLEILINSKSVTVFLFIKTELRNSKQQASGGRPVGTSTPGMDGNLVVSIGRTRSSKSSCIGSIVLPMSCCLLVIVQVVGTGDDVAHKNWSPQKLQKDSVLQD